MLIGGGICFCLIIAAISWGLVGISSPPKEKCPKCGKNIYPIELENSTYRECTCGYKKEK